MELPGERALFSRLTLKFTLPMSTSTSSVKYQAKVISLDQRFYILNLSTQFSVGEETLAQGQLQAFVRQDTPSLTSTGIEAVLPRSSKLQGKVALVTGGSRGLGAHIVQALALQGCKVILNYRTSRAEAEAVQASVQGAPGEIVLGQGDVADDSVCRSLASLIINQYGQLDFLLCNACPPLLPLWLDSSAATRINEYVQKSLALVSSPLSLLLEPLAASAGRCIVISSSAVQNPVAEWPHYVSAKYAIEGLTQVAAREYPTAHFLIVRPPRLLTDLTNTPLGRQNSIAPERVAIKIVQWALEPALPGCLAYLEEF
jgi:NAD(P)-dependent dehydrogenase (short-subunit alcohol dehydrogenase family)